MAIINFCGFETRDLSEIVSSAAATVVTNPSGSGYVVSCVPITTGTGFARLGLIGADGLTIAGTSANPFGTDCYYSARVRLATLPTATEELMHVRTNAGAYKLTLLITSSGG